MILVAQPLVSFIRTSFYAKYLASVKSPNLCCKQTTQPWRDLSHDKYFDYLTYFMEHSWNIGHINLASFKGQIWQTLTLHTMHFTLQDYLLIYLNQISILNLSFWKCRNGLEIPRICHWGEEFVTRGRSSVCYWGCEKRVALKILLTSYP